MIIKCTVCKRGRDAEVKYIQKLIAFLIWTHVSHALWITVGLPFWCLHPRDSHLCKCGNRKRPLWWIHELFSLTLVDTFTWTSLLCRCTDHTLIERIIFITFCAVCKAFCEKHNCFNQLLGVVFINFFKSNNAGSAYLRLSSKLHMNINKISACGSSAKENFVCKCSTSVKRKNVLFLPPPCYFCPHPHNKSLMCSMSAWHLLGLAGTRADILQVHAFALPAISNPKFTLYEAQIIKGSSSCGVPLYWVKDRSLTMRP